MTPRLLLVEFSLTYGPVMGLLDGGRRHLDLLDQLAFIGIDGVEPIEPVVLVYVRSPNNAAYKAGSSR